MRRFLQSGGSSGDNTIFPAALTRFQPAGIGDKKYIDIIQDRRPGWGLRRSLLLQHAQGNHRLCEERFRQLYYELKSGRKGQKIRQWLSFADSGSQRSNNVITGPKRLGGQQR